jgi:hypothetical protein
MFVLSLILTQLAGYVSDRVRARRQGFDLQEQQSMLFSTPSLGYAEKEIMAAQNLYFGLIAVTAELLELVV